MRDMYTKWNELQSLGINVCEYFRIRKIKHVAIYGNGEANTYLRRDLEQANISYSVNDNYEEADIIVVTELENYFEIEKSICENILVEVISISELVDRVYNNRDAINQQKEEGTSRA